MFSGLFFLYFSLFIQAEVWRMGDLHKFPIYRIDEDEEEEEEDEDEDFDEDWEEEEEE